MRLRFLKLIFLPLQSKEDDIVDICWRGTIRRRPTDCLFSVSKSGRLRRFEINVASFFFT